MVAVRLYELAYCCRLFGELVPSDAAQVRFDAGTEGAADLSRPRHRALLLAWLRAWGCRSLRTADERRCSEALRRWWAQWGPELPAAGVTLDALGEAELAAAASAYADLATRVGPRRQLPGRLLDVRFGATTAAKAMFALRPQAFVPWDAAIRTRLGFGEDAGAYRAALVRARGELREALADAGVPAAELPALIGRPHSTPPKLVDEHDWVRFTAGHEPPGRGELQRWLGWVSA